MNNSELDSILRKARLPEPGAHFWDALPGRIRLRLNQTIACADTAAPSLIARWPQIIMIAAGALAAILLAVLLTYGPKNVPDILENPKLIDETLAMFPHRVRAIVEDQQGLHLVLSDQADVPSSPPLYVCIREGQHCASAVTFSGQNVKIGAEHLTVLAESNGGIILEGNRFLWTSEKRFYSDAHIQIEAKALNKASM